MALGEPCRGKDEVVCFPFWDRVAGAQKGTGCAFSVLVPERNSRHVRIPNINQGQVGSKITPAPKGSRRTFLPLTGGFVGPFAA